MFLTIIIYLFVIVGYCAIGATFHNGLRKVVNADRWDGLKSKKIEVMDSLETEWSKGRYRDTILFLLFWPIWIFGGLFVVGLIGNNE